nr:reverse transcriptase domain-containing protein [Tanacetum cinerariifolium]
FADALLLMLKFASIIKSLLANKDKLFKLAKVPLNENYSAMLLKKLPEKLRDLGKFLIPCDFPGMEEITLRVNDESVTFNLDQVMRYSDSFVKRVNVINISSEEVVQDKPKSSNPTLVSKSDFCEDPIVKTSPFGESDFFLEDIENFLKDDSIPMEIENSVYDPEGDILYFENLLKEDPFQLPPMNLNQAKSLIKETEYSFSMGKVHAEYISLMERLITINPCPHPMMNANTIVESLPSSLIPVQDNDSQREDINIVTNTNELLPPYFENDDSEGEIDILEELRVDNSISNFKNELSDNEASDFDNPSFPRPPLEPPDVEFNFEPNAGEEISVMMNDNDELEYFYPRDEINVTTNNEDDNCFPFMFVIQICVPYLIYPKVFPFLLSAESEDTIFNPDIFV